ncbi:MAG: hypothetical protein J2P19_20885 [Pseudonocardia sp.]|nr:hypothetical protein [Pseudonocardia sp.]
MGRRPTQSLTSGTGSAPTTAHAQPDSGPVPTAHEASANPTVNARHQQGGQPG